MTVSPFVAGRRRVQHAMHTWCSVKGSVKGMVLESVFNLCIDEWLGMFCAWHATRFGVFVMRVHAPCPVQQPCTSSACGTLFRHAQQTARANVCYSCWTRMHAVCDILTLKNFCGGTAARACPSERKKEGRVLFPRCSSTARPHCGGGTHASEVRAHPQPHAILHVCAGTDAQCTQRPTKAWRVCGNPCD